MATKNITLKKLGKRFVATILAAAMIVSTITIQSANNIVGAEETAKSTDGYVIENKSSDTITVVINHLLNNSAIYSADSKEVSAYGKINNYKKAVNYEVTSVVVNDQTLSSSKQWSNIELSSSATINVNYSISDATVDRSVSFYDYLVRASGANDTNEENLSKSINYAGNYEDNELDNNFTVGHFNGSGSKNFAIDPNTGLYENIEDHQVYAKQRSLATTTMEGYDKLYNYENNEATEAPVYINAWRSNYYSEKVVNNGKVFYQQVIDGKTAIRRGIIKGLDNKKNVLFNYDNPGVFTDASVEKNGKQNIDDYKLRFNRSGDTYELRNVINNNNQAVLSNYTGTGSSNSKNFWPLDGIKNTGISKDEKAGDTTHNSFFGMRYDIEFSIGDYIGDLNYSFTGDDDLWVLLDDKVVIDLGGIHAAVSGNVDIWDALGLVKGNLTDVQKQETHRLTVLYMERGSHESNCYMNFTIPNATFVDVSSAPKAELTINKVSSEDNTKMLPGATFTLTNDANSSDVRTIVSDSNGRLYLNNLVEGTYTLTEVSAPDGYQITEGTYKVIVTNNPGGKTATAKLYKEDGVTEISGNIITNTPNKKIIDDTLDYEKTAKLAGDENSWDNREYDITINAKSKKSSTTTFNKAIDVAMVYDLSGSMNGDIDGSKFSSKKGNFVDKDLTNLGEYNRIVASLDKNKIYYYGNTKDDISDASGTTDGYNLYHNKPMKYIDGQWRYYSKNVWNVVPNNSKTNICIWNSRISALKEAASNFISGIANESDTSKLSLTGFRNYDLVNINSNLQIAKDNEISMLGGLNKVYCQAGTYPSKALTKVKEYLDYDKNIDSKDKYVIMFSDGAPSDSDARKNTETSADNLKKAGYTVICVLLGNADEKVPGVTKKAGTWLRDDISSNKKLYTATTSEGLNDIFKDLQGELTQPEDYKGVKIVDTISKEFKLTDDQKLAINNSNNVSYVENPDGTTTVTWIDQTVGYSESDWTWHGTLRVVAKDEFIGGNNVSTNVPGENNSYIEIPELGKAELQEPKVNVKLDFVVNNVNEVLFKGETFTNSEDMIKKLFDSSAVTNSKGTAITMYDPSAFSTQLYKADVNGDKTLETVDVGESFTTNDARYLDVTYNPGVASASATANTEGHTAQENNDNVKTGKLDVKFVAGRLAITKTINSQYADKFTASKTNATQTFVFKIDQYKDSTKAEKVRTFYETITFNANEDDTEKTKYISELEKGYYVVTEETSWSSKYSIDDSTAKVQEFNIGNTESTDDNGKKTFTGLDDNENCKYTELADGTAAGFSFKNILKPWANWYSDAATAKNKFNK